MYAQIDQRCHEAIVIDGVGSRVLFEPNMELSQFELNGISGTVQGGPNSGFHSLKSTIRLNELRGVKFKDMVGATGEWIGLFAGPGRNVGPCESKRFLIAADYFGFGKIHYAVVPSSKSPGCRTLIVSSSLRGVLRVLDDLGVESSIRWDVALPHIVSNVNLFRTRVSRQTFANEVEVLSCREALVVGAEGLCLTDRPRPMFGSSYEDMIDEGIDAAIADAQTAVNRGGPCSISLSGGKDSRALFSMLCAGGVEKDWKVVTKRPDDAASASGEIFRKDLQFASMIVDRYNLDWKSEDTGTYVDVSFDEFLSDHQNFRSNQSFEVVPQARLRRYSSESTTMGIGGELLRSYIARGYRDGYPGWWANSVNTVESSRNDLRELFRRIALPWKIPSDLYEMASSSFATGMMFDIEGSVLDHIDESYREYRSRAFSANMESNRLAGTYLTYPLARPQFVHASQLLPEEDRNDGRVLFDIIERCDPSLNALEFAAPPWPDRFRSEGTSSSWSAASIERAESKFQRQRAKMRSPRIVRRDVDNSSLRRDAWEMVSTGIEQLRDAVTQTWFDPLIIRAARRALFSDKSLYSLTSVIRTLLDVDDPVSVDISMVRICLEDGSMTSIEMQSSGNGAWGFEDGTRDRSKLGVGAADTQFARVAKGLDLASVTARLYFDDGVTTVAVDGLPDSAQVAVYLFKTGVCINRSGYQGADTFQFPDLEPDGVPDRATVFLRWEGDPDALRVFDIGTD